MNYIVKRNGDLVPFDKNKIINAINKAFLEVDGKSNSLSDSIADTIASINNATFSVEDIQNLIEEYLMHSDRRDVAKAYIRFRYKKEVAREHKDDFIAAIEEKLSASNV